MLTVLAAGKAAPGATTAAWALALSWPRPVLVVDGDPAGGDMAPGLLPGRVVTERGLLSWSMAARRGVPVLTSAAMFVGHVVELPEQPNLWLLPGFTSSAQAGAFAAEAWERLGLALERSWSALGRDALVDAGRLVGERCCWPVLRSADRVLLTVRPSVRSVHAAQDAAGRLRRELGDLVKVSALVVGDGPYSAEEVAAALGLPLAGRLPEDRGTARVLSDGATGTARTLSRSVLLRAAAQLARGLVASADASDPARAVPA